MCVFFSVFFQASVNFMEPLSEEQAVHAECIQQLENLVRQVGAGWEVKVGNSSVEGVSAKESTNQVMGLLRYIGTWVLNQKYGKTPKSSIKKIGFSIINHPFWVVLLYFWKHPHGIPCEISIFKPQLPGIWKCRQWITFSRGRS